MRANIDEFHLPRWQEIPDVGLYLEQTVKYLNTKLAPLGCIEMTGSMVSNYVKKGLVGRPVRKQYSAAQVASLLVIAIVKSSVSMENIAAVLGDYATITTYDYFCTQFEGTLRTLFALPEQEGLPLPDTSEHAALQGDALLTSVITAAAHAVYLSDCFAQKAEPAQG